ncbi:MAG: polysaccharide biosynthesis protein, partial [Campylobacterales bacterium]
IASFAKGRRILITGAGGSIGSEIARQCAHFGAARLALIDHSEFNLYQIGEELPEAELDMFSVTDRSTLDEKMTAFNPDIVIHAAAYKHVPLCEANQQAAVTNNVLGTKNVIDASIGAGVEKLVIVSTDKAVRPTNVMGATKRVTELYAGNVDSKETEIVAVRFGNVLGSSGSVIPKFKRQIEEGGPVTVTHPEMTRYFMLIPEACQLVLQAAAIAKGGELFILDMGEPVKIVDLAKQMIRLYGKQNEVEITFCGLRPGEKLFEELLIDDSEKKTQYSSIFIAGKTDYPIEILEKDIKTLLQAEDKVAALKKIVPEFEHRP